MLIVDEICDELGRLIADKKTEGPSTIIVYLVLIVEYENMMIKIPMANITKLLEFINFFSS